MFVYVMSLNQQQIEDLIGGLKKTTVRLSLHRETLSQQTTKVAEQIEAVFEVQREALNQRRQWLLHQLALVKADKMDSISRKQEIVDCSLANIQKLLSDPSKYNHSHIKESFESMHKLMSEDTRPFIAFRSDPALLREIISQYGVILKQYGGHFADPTRPSISLPSVVEEEDDEEGVAFTKKDEVSKNDENNVLHVTTFPANSSIVRAWLMTENYNSNCIESGLRTPKSDCDSFVKIDSNDSEDSKEMKDIDDKEIWLSKEKSTLPSDYSDLLRPFTTIKNQNDSLWLSKFLSTDDDKEVDHYEFVKKACLVGNCKNFTDCSQKENCCNKLIDPTKPSWNKWLLDNNVFKYELLTPQISTFKNTFSNDFQKILKSDNKKWLAEKKNDRRTAFGKDNDDDGRKKKEVYPNNSGNKAAKYSYYNHGSIFNDSLEKWISVGRDLKGKSSQNGITEVMNKTSEKISLEEWDGLIRNEDEETKKWLMDNGV